MLGNNRLDPTTPRRQCLSLCGRRRPGSVYSAPQRNSGNCLHCLLQLLAFYTAFTSGWLRFAVFGCAHKHTSIKSFFLPVKKCAHQCFMLYLVKSTVGFGVMAGACLC